ncbi:hypothetical protein [Haloglycomyces albus]|uniref:hypothetical protein n=1 Tax=Haloglycomyces albus TaxID=526067 RepID=UPI00046D92FD|nr:hypothetical protein [Haloglycomyces albus]
MGQEHVTHVESLLEKFEKALAWRHTVDIAETMSSYALENAARFPTNEVGPGHMALEGGGSGMQGMVDSIAAGPEALKVLAEKWNFLNNETIQRHLGYCDTLKFIDTGSMPSGDPREYNHRECNFHVPNGNTGDGEEYSVDQEVLAEGCQAIQVLRTANEWAAEDRDVLEREILWFADHDVEELKDRWDLLVRAIGTLDHPMDNAASPSSDVEMMRDLSQDVSLYEAVQTIDTSRGGSAWMVDWTGLAADTAAEGFFSNLITTLGNQSGIMVGCAQAINARANSIVQTREQTIEILESAITAASNIQTTETHLKDQGDAFNVSKAIVDLVPVIGDSISSIVGIAQWQQAKFGDPKTIFINNTIEVVVKHYGLLRAIKHEVEEFETLYETSVSKLYSSLGSVPSRNLELYDISRNNPEGSGNTQDGYHVDISVLFGMAKQLSGLGEGYDRLVHEVRGLDSSLPSLATHDGSATPPDNMVTDLNEFIIDIIRTTSARYYAACEQLRDAALAYSEADNDSVEDAQRYIDDLEDAGKLENDFNPGDISATETDFPAGGDDTGNYDFDNPYWEELEGYDQMDYVETDTAKRGSRKMRNDN